MYKCQCLLLCISPHSWCPRIVQVFIDHLYYHLPLYITLLGNYTRTHLRNPTPSDMKLTTHILRSLRARPLAALRSSSSRTLLTQSHYRGASEPPLLQQTIGSHIASVASKYGDSPAVISKHQNIRLSYDDLHTQSTALAHGLAGIGVKKGDRIAVSLGNNAEFAIATYAVFKLGAILVPLNPSFNLNQFTSALNHLDVAHLIISLETNLPRKPPKSNVPLFQELFPSLETSIESELVPSLKNVLMVDNSYGRIDPSRFKAFKVFRNTLEDGTGRGALSEEGLDPNDIVNIQFTSGTTSMPKAACLTHIGILNNGNSIGDRMLLTNKDIVCCPPPLFHCFGCVLGYMATATHGSAIVFPSESFDPLLTLKAVQEEKCTALYGVPTMFTAELELLQKGEVPYEGFQYLRTGIAAGSSVPTELMKKLHSTLNLTELTICYGMTETSPVSAMTTTDDPLAKRVDSVGRLLPHVEAKIVSATDRNKILPIGERGELVVSGYLVQKGYWNDPVRTAEVMMQDEKGNIWMHTGDEAEMDEEGYIKITGRLKDLIIRGGENIHPLEIENCLLSHPSVIEASVVGLKDERYGEVVAVFLRKDESKDITPDEVRDWVREKLSHHLVPKYVFFVDGYPKTASGKIKKFVLQEMGAQLVLEQQKVKE
ncbi:acyl-CoA synthetase/AMP-acid ligase-like protein II [Morchella snyderi]|nr:acyl-CoA synthetase/AMP-acid ligase-like protein II [Morchella snyderi]